MGKKDDNEITLNGTDGKPDPKLKKEKRILWRALYTYIFIALIGLGAIALVLFLVGIL